MVSTFFERKKCLNYQYINCLTKKSPYSFCTKRKKETFAPFNLPTKPPIFKTPIHFLSLH